MATQQAIALPDLLGKTITILETVHGFQFERTGRVIGIIRALPGSRCREEFLLDQDDGSCEYYDPQEVTITRID
ncbi:TPA: hypothetical protein L5P97_006391 [Pseudomonas aeruginosa]|nr:hypothetical protein [Pseudomonas aeruginosa]HBP0417482.1 hypothetical protein [Pseudomonas aeruginosa]HBP0559849.1 hypothetical protein [Pseudomonas aeruginosa]HBP0586416.1 hypothetical protein [Pseudomonas aeruginosa]HBP0606540.1 hypothetical protein [Pseudomonas aeruginosa]